MVHALRSSIIVVTYNHRRHIEHCLRTLLPTLSGADEVVVVDNASADGTADYIAAAFPSVRLVRRKDNPGFGAACNVGAGLSTAEFLVFLNPDTEPQPGWLDALLAPLRSFPRVGLVTPKLLLRDRPELIDTFGHDVHISGIATCRGWGEPATAHPRVEEVAAVSGACFGITRELFLRLGGFDARLFLYYEDDDLSLRARLAGLGCLAVPDAIVLHDHAEGVSAAKLRYLERNRWFSVLRTYRWRTLAALLPVLAGAEILVWIHALRSGPAHIGAKGRAWRDLARMAPDLASSRKRIQAERVVGDREMLRLHGARLPVAQVAQGFAAAAGERMATAAFAGVRRVALALIAA